MDLIPVTSIELVGEVTNNYAAQNAFRSHQERLAANTLRRHEADLAVFSTYLAKAGVVIDDLLHNPASWQGITHGMVELFVRWMLEQGYAVGTVNLKLSTVKAYCKLATKAGVISSAEYAMINLVTGYSYAHGLNVDEKRKEKQVETRIGDKKAAPVALSLEQVKKLKSQPDTAIGRRDQFLICLMLELGFRVGEVAALTVNQLTLADGTIEVYRKKVGKKQTHSLTKETLLAAIRYLEVAKPVDKLVMGSRKGGKLEGSMSERAINERVRKLGKAIEVNELSPHDLRHDWATRAVRAGTDIKALQEAGGWNSPVMPLRYAVAGSIANEGVKLV